MKNLIIGVVAFTVLFIGLGWLMVGRTPEAQIADLEVTQEDHITGNASASATLVEYSDFQCPACKGYQPFVSQLKEDLGDQLRIVFRHMPLRSIHPNAQLAAQAAEAAALQNKFWEMNDLLFETQDSWSNLGDPTEIFIQHATNLELDVEKFTKDLTSKEIEETVNNDYSSGIQAGVNSTPSFFINGKLIKNPASYEVFREIIESEL